MPIHILLYKATLSCYPQEVNTKKCIPPKISSIITPNYIFFHTYHLTRIKYRKKLVIFSQSFTFNELNSMDFYIIHGLILRIFQTLNKRTKFIIYSCIQFTAQHIYNGLIIYLQHIKIIWPYLRVTNRHKISPCIIYKFM